MALRTTWYASTDHATAVWISVGGCGGHAGDIRQHAMLPLVPLVWHPEPQLEGVLIRDIRDMVYLDSHPVSTIFIHFLLISTTSTPY